MTTYNLREASKHGIPTPREGYEQRKVLYKKYNEAVIKGWSKRIDDNGQDYTDKDFVLCERKIDDGYPKIVLNGLEIATQDDLTIKSIDEALTIIYGSDADINVNHFLTDKESVGYIDVPEIKPEDIHGILVSGNQVSVTLEKDDDGKFIETSRNTKKKRVRKPTL